MIKRLSFIITLMTMVFVAHAKRISEVAAYEKAAQAARSIIPERRGSDRPVTLAYKSDSYYVYNYAGGGFVIVSGSDLTDEVLGYSRTGSFNANDIPENMTEILESYNKEIDYIEKNKIKPCRSRSEETLYDDIAPMIDSQWGQGRFYNEFLPIITNGDFQYHAFVGCVALALGEVVAYHKKEINLSGYYSAIDIDNNRTLELLLDTCTVNYDNILPEYNSDASEDQIHEVSRFLKLCGYLLRTAYRKNASAAYTDYCVSTLCRMGFNENVKYISQYYIQDQEVWESMIYNSLKDYGPVIYRANNSTNSGHAWVCDGYENGYFHMNWGWDGACNGFYKLTCLDAGCYNFNIPDAYHGAVINITPNDTDAGISDVEYGMDEYPVCVYDISGNIVYTGYDKKPDFLTPGIYIMTDGSTTRKVLIK